MVARHWDCPSLGTNFRYMLFPLARSNFGTSKCELRGTVPVMVMHFFLATWVAGKASFRLNSCKSLIINLKCFECRLPGRKNCKTLIKLGNFEDVLNSFRNIAQNQGLILIQSFVGGDN